MATKILKHKGYQGTVEVDFENNRLSGKVLHIKSLITYCGDTPEALHASFEEEVDEYIADCIALGVEPEKPFSGTFQVRTTPELHKQLTTQAVEKGVTFNKFVTWILETECQKPPLAEFARIGEKLNVADWKHVAPMSEVMGIRTTRLTPSLEKIGENSKQNLMSYDYGKCH